MITAKQLDAAAASHTSIARSADIPATPADAYEIQRAFAALRARRTGSAIAAYKIAVTSSAAQSAVSTGGYGSGILLDSEVLHSGATVRLSERFKPIIEVELAFRVRETIEPGDSAQDVLSKTDVSAGIEIPESRFQNWFGGEYPSLKFTEVLSDNCTGGLIVVGDTWTPATDVDLIDAPATLHHDSELVRLGSTAIVVPNPQTAVAWLAGLLAERDEKLSPGVIVSSGTWTETIVLTPGTWVADFGSTIGSVTIELIQ